jgi:TRAP-type uncharacterized transport system fused permease subunit
MNVKLLGNYLVGLIVFLQDPRSRSERGLSQSAENAILLAGAVAVAGVIISVITVYVSSHLPR